MEFVDFEVTHRSDHSAGFYTLGKTRKSFELKYQILIDRVFLKGLMSDIERLYLIFQSMDVKDDLASYF